MSDSSQNLNETTAFIEMLKATKEFSAAEIIVTRAPGRLDLMGGIADYSGSLVLQLPIANATHAALQIRDDQLLRLISIQSNQPHSSRIFEIPLPDLLKLDYESARQYFQAQPERQWVAYVAGAFIILQREKKNIFSHGATILLSSNVPEGKGVSSSAALEVASMSAILAGYGEKISATEIAFLCQKVENLIAGAPCGVMDQMTSVCGEAHKLLALLCQPGEIKGFVDLPDELAVWGIDSGVRHSVGGADYGTVRTAAFMGYRIIARLAGLAVRKDADRVIVEDARWHGYLANLTPEEFENSFAKFLPEKMRGAEFLREYQSITDAVTAVAAEREYPILQATRHPIYENARVEKFKKILQSWKNLEQAKELGELMYQSHASYSACGLGAEATDTMVAMVRAAGAELFGAKITGGGSGGTVAVLGKRDAEEKIFELARKYEQNTGRPVSIISGSSQGAESFGHRKLVDNQE